MYNLQISHVGTVGDLERWVIYMNGQTLFFAIGSRKEAKLRCERFKDVFTTTSNETAIMYVKLASACIL